MVHGKNIKRNNRKTMDTTPNFFKFLIILIKKLANLNLVKNEENYLITFIKGLSNYLRSALVNK